MGRIGNSIFGKGPQRRKTYTKKVRGSRPTEFHQDLCSFGATCKSARLSDEEFALQILDEFAYLADSCVKSAFSVVARVCDLFGKIFCS